MVNWTSSILKPFYLQRSLLKGEKANYRHEENKYKLHKLQRIHINKMLGTSILMLKLQY